MIGMVLVNLIFLRFLISRVAVRFNQQMIDYHYGNLVIEPKENQGYIIAMKDGVMETELPGTSEGDSGGDPSG